jgi:hypothetical protein
MLQGGDINLSAWPRLNRAAAAEADCKNGAQKPDAKQQHDQQPAHAADDGLEALLAAFEIDESAAAPASSRPAASKKKKKETAAQREAKKQQKLRLQRLQEQQQQQQESEDGSSFGPDADERDEEVDKQLSAAVGADPASSSCAGAEGLEAAQGTHPVADARATSVGHPSGNVGGPGCSNTARGSSRCSSHCKRQRCAPCQGYKAAGCRCAWGLAAQQATAAAAAAAAAGACTPAPAHTATL